MLVLGSLAASALNPPVQIMAPPQRPASVRAWMHPPTRAWEPLFEEDEAAAAGGELTEGPAVDLSTEFARAMSRANALSAMETEVKRLASPDVPLWIVFEGAAQPAVLPGSGKTDALHDEASRLHNLDPSQKLRFLLEDDELHLGVPIAESPLANSQDLQVRVMATEWPVRRGRLSTTAFSAGGVATTASRMSSVAARRIRRERMAKSDASQPELLPGRYHNDGMDFRRYHN